MTGDPGAMSHAIPSHTHTHTFRDLIVLQELVGCVNWVDMENLICVFQHGETCKLLHACNKSHFVPLFCFFISDYSSNLFRFPFTIHNRWTERASWYKHAML